MTYRARWMVVLSLAATTAGCKFPYPPDVGGDASAAGRVGGTLTGMWQGGVAELRLVSAGIDETLVVDSRGAFQFTGNVESGSTFEVTVSGVPDRHRCSVEHGTGTAPAAGVNDVDVRCTIDVPLTITSSLPFERAFDPAVSEYDFMTSLLVQGVTFRVDGAGPAAITIDDMPLAQGVRSAPIELVSGANDVAVAVTLGALSNTYHLRVDRGAVSVAQGVYGKASNADPNDNLGMRAGSLGLGQGSVAIDGDVMVVGAPSEDSAPGIGPGDNSRMESGAAYVFVRDGQTWNQVAMLKAPNADAFDNFGGGVAVSGDVIVVASWGEDSSATTVNGDQTSNAAPNAGAVYVYRRVGQTWPLEAYLKAPNAEAQDMFGVSIALDGNTLVVGAPQEGSAVPNDRNNNAAANAGAAYVFVYGVGSWSLQAYLKATLPRANNFFGAAVDIEGDRIAVGASSDSSAATTINGDHTNQAAPGAGAAYVFRRIGSGWSQEAYIKAPNAQSFDQFGWTLELGGQRLVVCARGEDSAALGIGGNMADNSADGAGASYVFSRATGAWQFEAYVKTTNSEAGDMLQAGPPRYALHGDILAIGVEQEDSNAKGLNGNQSNNSATESGAVYVYHHDGTNWRPYSYVKASNSEAGDRFGVGAALSFDGLVVVAPRESSGATTINGDQASNAAPASGAFYVFR